MASRIRKPACFTISNEAASGLAEVAAEMGLSKSEVVDRLILQAAAASTAERNRTQRNLAANKGPVKVVELFGGAL